MAANDNQQRYTDLSGASRARPRSTPAADELARAAARAANQRAMENRLARIEGHVRSIKRMVEEQRRAEDVLTQVAAVKAAINKFSAVYIKMELEDCMTDSEKNTDRLERITDVITTLLKQS